MEEHALTETETETETDANGDKHEDEDEDTAADRPQLSPQSADLLPLFRRCHNSNELVVASDAESKSESQSESL